VRLALTPGGSIQGGTGMKKIVLAGFALTLALPLLIGCTHVRRAWDHTKWHINGAYQDLVEIHKTVDRHVFNLDEKNPDRY
jgi:hypothetical protein